MRDGGANEKHARLTECHGELAPAAHGSQDEVIHQQKTDQRGHRKHTKDHPCIDRGGVVVERYGAGDGVRRDDVRLVRPCAVREAADTMAPHSVTGAFAVHRTGPTGRLEVRKTQHLLHPALALVQTVKVWPSD